jgi:hypothetical protein
VPIFAHRVAFFGKNPTNPSEGRIMAQEILSEVRVR